MTGANGEAKIEQFADRVDRKLRAAEAAELLVIATSSKVRVVLVGCGFQKQGKANMRKIEAALAARSIFPHIPLHPGPLDPNLTIHFTRTPQSAQGRSATFPAEHMLEKFIESNFGLLFPNLRLVGGGNQVPVRSGRIDVLAQDDDSYVVIELKKNLPDDRLPWQMKRYMEDVAAWAATKRRPKKVRGLVITAASDQRMVEYFKVEAEREGVEIDWVTYRVDFTLTPARGASANVN